MTLSPKLKREINYVFTKLYKTAPDVEGFLQRAGVPVTFLNTQKPARECWPDIVDFTEKNEMIKQILDRAKVEYDSDTALHAVCEEFSSGFDSRVLRLATAISQEKCILFLGPGMLQYQKDATTILSFHAYLAEQLVIKLNQYDIYFDERFKSDVRYLAQRYKTNPKYVKGDLGHLAKTAFSNISQTVLQGPYQDLAKLRFPLIINANPDKLILEHIQRTKGMQFADLHYYSGYHDSTDLDEQKFATGAKCHIYNIFGSLDNIYSMPFTESDFVAFSKNVLQRTPGLSSEVLSKFDETKYYLFLGFEFSLWHLKILLEALNIVRTEERGVSIYIDKPLPHHELEYFDKEFKFHFFDHNISSFILALVQTYEKSYKAIQLT